jgi:hypothetical protein
MVDKINVTPHGTPDDDGSFSEIQEEFENCYHSIIDSSFFALGRIITLHLTPTKTEDTDGVQASTPAVHYNPFSRGGGRQVPNQISTTRVPAVKITHRDVEYVAHIKHGPKDADDKGGVELSADEVQTTTLIESAAHLSGSLTATIDGARFNLDSTRQIGLRDVRYVISKWKAVNEVENG